MKSDDCKSTIVYWHSQVHYTAAVAFVERAMERFAEEVTRQVGRSISVCKVPDDEGNVVNELLTGAGVTDQDHPISNLVLLFTEELTHRWRLMIYCPDAPVVRDMARHQMKIKHDPWGVENGCKAFVFHPNIEQVIWHEALHTIGADECYDPADPYAPFPLCTDPLCLMRFQPEPANCGDGFPMCSRVIDHIRKALTD